VVGRQLLNAVAVCVNITLVGLLLALLMLACCQHCQNRGVGLKQDSSGRPAGRVVTNLKVALSGKK
jgi:hypothetical protein